ncbi:MAG: hypothetical protein NTV12_09825 [Verrucomicrobia bacterium]|nr:hypothetical protein [Verrucomicrobiota bacterium]
MFLDPLRVGQSGKLEEPKRQTAGARLAYAVGQCQPHLARHLSADSMETQGGQQADHSRRRHSTPRAPPRSGTFPLVGSPFLKLVTPHARRL